MGRYLTKGAWMPLLLLACSVMLIGMVACGGDDSEDKGTVILTEQDWDGSLVTTELIKAILTQELGYTVETKFASADSMAMMIGLQDGDMHFVCCVWPNFSAPLIEEFVDGKGTVESLGWNGVIGKSGWWVPTYLVEGDEARGIEAAAPNLKSWKDLNQYKDLFETADSRGLGRYTIATPEWLTYDEERIESLGLDYMVHYSGSEAAMIADWDGAYSRGEPILMHAWTPHWLFGAYDMTEVILPEPYEGCQGPDLPNDCGWEEVKVNKFAWPGLKDEAPEAYEFLSNFNMDNVHASKLVLDSTQGGMTKAEAVAAWMEANEDIWKAWIP